MQNIVNNNVYEWEIIKQLFCSLLVSYMFLHFICDLVPTIIKCKNFISHQMILLFHEYH